MIRFDHVEVSVPTWTTSGRRATKTLLTGVDLELPERRVAVIGANGSGKSTLLRMVNGLVSPTVGTVVVEGVDAAADPKRVRRLVGFVFTDPLSQLVMPTPGEDIELSLRRVVKDKAARKRRALDLLDARGLDHAASQSIYDLSGGERQLVSLTSVLAVDPRVVVADEPTTLLDLRNRAQVIDALLALDAQLVYATHDLEFAAQADRALVVDDGRVVFDGNPGEAIAHYRRRMGVGR